MANDGGKQFAADRLAIAPASTDEQMKAIDHLVADSHLGGDQANVADIVLGARMMAARQMDVDRRFERHSHFKVARQEHCLLYTSPSPRDKRQSRMPSSA